MVTIKDLAFVLKLDVSTVSRALRKDPRVKESTRERVLFLAKEMGYKPNLAARSLVKGNSRTIWFILPELTDPVEGLLPQFSSLKLAEMDYDLLIATYQDNQMIYKRLLNRLTQGIADGALVSRGYGNNKCPIVERLLRQNYPIVFLDRYLENSQARAVTTDNISSSGQLVQMCYENGVDFFLVLFTSMNDNVVEQNRLKGTIQRIKKLKLSYRKAGTNKTRWLSGDLPEKIAIFASSQKEILSFVNVHYKIFQGKKLFFSVFDHWMGDPSPAEKIFIVKQDFERISEIAVEMIVKMIEKKKLNCRELIKVPPLEFVTLENTFYSKENRDDEQ